MADTVTISRLDYNLLIYAVNNFLNIVVNDDEFLEAHGPYVLDLEDLLVRLHKENN